MMENNLANIIENIAEKVTDREAPVAGFIQMLGDGGEARSSRSAASLS
jgi:hypothetical protein